ncbi:MAG: M24 family metallopeptidase [Lentisphaerae bacterium]|nr:M24 family metallopeptidase [Lentisphaerota bacterium]
MEGFIHSVGHGLGLDVHEAPRVGRSGERLRAGQVITVEPGLYYRATGGVRVEDVVVVTPTGCDIIYPARHVFQV